MLEAHKDVIFEHHPDGKPRVLGAFMTTLGFG